MPSDLNLKKPTAICTTGVTVLLLSGCVAVSDGMTELSSSRTAAFAVVDGRVLRGEARLSAERAGSVQLQSADNPSLTCFGPLMFTATMQGVIRLSCSNGRTVAVSFQSLSPLGGAGRGNMETADAGAPSRLTDFALTYGLRADQASAYLGVPAASLMPPVAGANTMAPTQP